MPTHQWSIKNIVRIPAAGLVTAVLGLLPMTAMGAVTPPSSAFAVGSATSGICMQAAGETSGSAVVLGDCNNQINQKWYTNRAGYYNGAIAYDFETAKAGSFQCLNDENSSTAAGSLVTLAQCNGVMSAMRFVKNGNELVNIASGECLDSSTVGAQLVLNPCVDGVSSQQWFGVANNAKP
jgi:hypothetical protein